MALGFTLILTTLMAVVTALTLVFDARWRDFPFAALTMAVVPLWMLTLLNPLKSGARPIAETLFAGLLAIIAVYIGFNEGFHNWQALSTAAAYGLLGATLWQARVAVVAGPARSAAGLSSDDLLGKKSPVVHTDRHRSKAGADVAAGYNGAMDSRQRLRPPENARTVVDRLCACRQELCRQPRHRGRGGGGRRLARGRRGRIPRHCRQVGLGQDHAVAAGQPADRGGLRHDRHRGRGHQPPRPDRLRRRIGYVFQSGGLFPHLSVAGNIGITPKLLGWPETTISARVDELLGLVQLDRAQYRDRLPDELSGGQRQRVGVARALAAAPRIVLMDEPFGALDPLTRDALGDDFRELHRKLALTTVMITHDMTEAILLADRIAVMRGGKLLAQGTATELSGSGDAYVSELLRTPRRQAERLGKLLPRDGAV